MNVAVNLWIPEKDAEISVSPRRFSFIVEDGYLSEDEDYSLAICM
jgi:hypothetical protein